MLKVFILIITLAFMLSCGSKGDVTSGVMSSPTLDTIYVDASATGNNDGTSWSNAYTDLQAAIDDAGSKVTGNGVIKIHLAVGTYTPSGWPNGGNIDREKHFALKDGIEVYGGYPAGGGTIPTGDQSETILSGDIGAKGNNSDNVYHVFYHTSSSGLTTKAKLENLTITEGNANGGSVIPNQGSGMYNDSSSPTLTKVTFTNNTAPNGYGGGLYNTNNSSPTLTNVTFAGNNAFRGGGMANVNSSNPSLTDVAFTNNTANYGGGIGNIRSNPTLTRVTFTNNVVTFLGGGMYNYSSSPTLNDVSFTGNRTELGGGLYNTNNSSPILTNVTFNDNQADEGGGVYNRASNPSLTGCTFTNNTATSVGGAMYSDGTSEPNFTDNPLIPTNDAVASRNNGYYK